MSLASHSPSTPNQGGNGTESDRPRRRVLSYVRREGRITPGQRRALETLWPRYGLDPESHPEPLELDRVFGRVAPRILEIGFGNGEALYEMAAAHPENDYIGIEVHRPGVGKLLAQLEADGLNNVRVFCADGLEVLRNQISDHALDEIYIFFPDPWSKKRHHKRRLIQPSTAVLLGEKLKPGGLLCLATDWEDYAWHMLEVLEATPGFRNKAGEGRFTARPVQRPRTKFEQRGERRGHKIRDLLFVYEGTAAKEGLKNSS